MNSINFKKYLAGLIFMTSVMFSGCAPINVTGQEMSVDVTTHASRGDVQTVANATANLVTGINGATLNLDTTDLQPDHIYTTWFVVFNKPEACASSPCSAKDLLGNTDGVEGEVGYATGAIADENGQANFFAHMELGAVPSPWFGNGFNNPNAEIHLVLMDHGPEVDGRADEMLDSLRGGCTDESVPAPYPAVAHANGFAGPNTCQLYQVAIFVQS